MPRRTEARQTQDPAIIETFHNLGARYKSAKDAVITEASDVIFLRLTAAARSLIEWESFSEKDEGYGDSKARKIFNKWGGIERRYAEGLREDNCLYHAGIPQDWRFGKGVKGEIALRECLCKCTFGFQKDGTEIARLFSESGDVGEYHQNSDWHHTVRHEKNYASFPKFAERLASILKLPPLPYKLQVSAEYRSKREVLWTPSVRGVSPKKTREVETSKVPCALSNTPDKSNQSLPVELLAPPLCT